MATKKTSSPDATEADNTSVNPKIGDPPAETVVIEPPIKVQPAPQKKQPSNTEKPEFVFARYPGARICSKCKSKTVTNSDGSPRCAIADDENCPFLKK